MGIFEAMTPQQIARQFDVNVFGVMNTIRAILPHFRIGNDDFMRRINARQQMTDQGYVNSIRQGFTRYLPA